MDSGQPSDRRHFVHHFPAWARSSVHGPFLLYWLPGHSELIRKQHKRNEPGQLSNHVQGQQQGDAQHAWAMTSRGGPAGTVAYTHNPSTWEVEAKGSWIWSHLHSMVKPCMMINLHQYQFKETCNHVEDTPLGVSMSAIPEDRKEKTHCKWRQHHPMCPILVDKKGKRRGSLMSAVLADCHVLWLGLRLLLPYLPTMGDYAPQQRAKVNPTCLR